MADSRASDEIAAGTLTGDELWRIVQAGANRKVTLDEVAAFILAGITGSLPPGGTTGQVLTKQSGTDGDADWEDVDGLPPGGTTGQVLKKQSGTDGDADWEDESGGGGGGLVLLGTQTAANSAALSFAGIITSTYDEYVFEFLNLVPATNATYLAMRCSTNGGSSYDTTSGAYQWAGNFIVPGAVANQGNGFTNEIRLAQSISSTASRGGANGSAKIINPLSSTHDKHVLSHCSVRSASNSNQISHQPGAGFYESATPVDAVTFFMGSGNITSGVIRAYGVPK